MEKLIWPVRGEETSRRAFLPQLNGKQLIKEQIKLVFLHCIVQYSLELPQMLDADKKCDLSAKNTFPQRSLHYYM